MPIQMAKTELLAGEARSDALRASSSPMKGFLWIPSIALAFVLAIRAQPPQAPADKNPDWAFPSEVERMQPPTKEIPGPIRLPGSVKSYTQEQIDDLALPPDWYPDEHDPAPLIVRHGTNNGGFACGSCHLMSGHGSPETADLTGLTADYIEQQMGDFQRVRKEPIQMTAIARTTSTEDASNAAEWFASLKTGRWVKVIERGTVPKTYVGPGRMRFAEPGGSTEPIGHRIIELPEDATRARRRDPQSGFIAYVPPGSITRGKNLVKTLRCESCHGEGLKGSVQAPRLAGVHPIYLVRQLYNFQTGARGGNSAESMKPVVANLSDGDIIAIAAYAAAQAPDAKPVVSQPEGK